MFFDLSRFILGCRLLLNLVLREVNYKEIKKLKYRYFLLLFNCGIVIFRMLFLCVLLFIFLYILYCGIFYDLKLMYKKVFFIRNENI